MNNSSVNFQTVLTQVIQKLMLIFGPDLTLARFSQISGLRLDASGKIVAIEGIDQQIVKDITDSFLPLSPIVVAEYITPLLQSYTKTLAGPPTAQPNGAGTASQPTSSVSAKVFV